MARRAEESASTAIDERGGPRRERSGEAMVAASIQSAQKKTTDNFLSVVGFLGKSRESA